MIQQQTSLQQSTDFIFTPNLTILGISNKEVTETLNLKSSFLHLVTKLSMDSTPIVGKHFSTRKEVNLDLDNTNWAPNWRGWAAIISPQLFVDYLNSNINYSYKSDYKIIPILKFKEKSGLALLNNDLYISTSTYNVEENNLLTTGEAGIDVITMEDVPPTESDYPYKVEEHINKIVPNTFCNSQGFYKIAGKSFNFKYENITLDSGFYVFNVNYVQLKDTFLIKVTITIGESELKYVYLEPKSNLKSNKFPYVVFYNPAPSAKCAIKVEVNCNKSDSNYESNATRGYIKNVGLFKVNDSLDNELPEEYRLSKFNQTSAILFELNSKIYRSIVLQPVFCFKEVDENGNKFGCMNETYGGFQQLPDKPYQTCIAVYGLGANNRAYFLDTNTEIAKTICSDIIGEITIRQLNNN